MKEFLLLLTGVTIGVIVKTKSNRIKDLELELSLQREKDKQSDKADV